MLLCLAGGLHEPLSDDEPDTTPIDANDMVVNKGFFAKCKTAYEQVVALAKHYGLSKEAVPYIAPSSDSSCAGLASCRRDAGGHQEEAQ